MTLLDGRMEKVSLIGWHSNKIDRVVRSPGAAEAAAVVNGEDILYHARHQWGEMCSGGTNVFELDETVRSVPGCVVSDSRNVFDKLSTEELSTQGAERRTSLELMCVKHSQRTTGLIIRWVHAVANSSCFSS